MYNYKTENKLKCDVIGKVATIAEDVEDEQVKRTKQSKAAVTSPLKAMMGGSSVANRAALFESSSPTKISKEKDPALLSVSERKALFEKCKGLYTCLII